MATNVFNNAIFRNVGVAEQVVVAPAATSMALQLDIANVLANDVTASAYIKRGGNAYHIIKDGSIGVGESLQVIYGQKIVLLAGDSLCVTASEAAAVDVICSVLEDV